MWSVVVISI